MYRGKRVKRSHRRKLNKRFVILVGSLLGLVMILCLNGCRAEDPANEVTPNATDTPVVDLSYTIPAETLTEEPVEEPVQVVVDPINYEYPYNTMSVDWGVEVYEEGFKYYTIPQEYIDAGGCFPEIVQVYLWSLCKDLDIDYCMVVALIERESEYKWDAIGDSGNSKGYMQIYQRWHGDRMELEGVEDLHDPYGNIRVGLNYLHELIGRYGTDDLHYILMCYNMGEGGCREANAEGIYTTAYSRGVLQRTHEIELELQD